MDELTGTPCSTYEVYTKADAVSKAVRYATAGAVAISAINRTGKARHAWILAVPAAIDYIVDKLYKKMDNEED